jgi:hypothetical protein
MSITNFAYSARCAGAWLVLAALTGSFGLQLLTQLREFRTVGSPAVEALYPKHIGRSPRDTKLKTRANCHRNNHESFACRRRWRTAFSRDICAPDHNPTEILNAPGLTRRFLQPSSKT